MSDVAQLQQYIQALEKGDESSKRQAIHSLKHYKDQEWSDVPVNVLHSVVKALHNQLSSGMKQPSVRQDVATILGNMGPHSEPAIPQLIELLQEGNADALCEAAAVALGKIGKDAKVAVGPLIALLSNRRPTLIVQVVRALSEIGCADQRVQSALVSLWLSSGESQKTQMQVAIALCKLKITAKGLLKFLTDALVANQDASFRQSAAEALAWCNKKEIDVVPALLTAALHDKNEEVRQVAEASLVQLRLSHDDAIHLCAQQLVVSPYAEAALRNSGQPAVPALIGALRMQESTTREKAARILGSFGELAIESVPALTSTLHDKDLNVRLAAAKGLWNVGKKADPVIPVLADLLEDKWAANFEPGESRRRFLQSVIESLGRIGPPAKGAIPALTHKTKDKNRLISESAFTAIKEIAPPVASKAASR